MDLCGTVFCHKVAKSEDDQRAEHTVCGNLISALHLTCVLTSPEIIGYRQKSTTVWASNTKFSFTLEITTSPNVLPAIATWLVDVSSPADHID